MELPLFISYKPFLLPNNYSLKVTYLFSNTCQAPNCDLSSVFINEAPKQVLDPVQSSEWDTHLLPVMLTTSQPSLHVGSLGSEPGPS
jgi:hypothetical protein